jgi:hypothetical protein
MVMRACHPNYTESINKRIVVQASLGIKARPYLKKKLKQKKKKKDWQWLKW